MPPTGSPTIPRGLAGDRPVIPTGSAATLDGRASSRVSSIMCLPAVIAELYKTLPGEMARGSCMAGCAPTSPIVPTAPRCAIDRAVTARLFVTRSSQQSRLRERTSSPHRRASRRASRGGGDRCARPPLSVRAGHEKIRQPLDRRHGGPAKRCRGAPARLSHAVRHRTPRAPGGRALPGKTTAMSTIEGPRAGWKSGSPMRASQTNARPTDGRRRPGIWPVQRPPFYLQEAC